MSSSSLKNLPQSAENDLAVWRRYLQDAYGDILLSGCHRRDVHIEHLLQKNTHHKMIHIQSLEELQYNGNDLVWMVDGENVPRSCVQDTRGILVSGCHRREVQVKHTTGK